MKALIIDDDASVAELLQTLLGEIGCDEIRSVGSGAEALRSLGEARPDLILLDLGLPDMGGLMLCRQLGAHPALLHVPIIVITARDDEHALPAAFEAGACDYLAKPFRAVELIARIRAALRLRAERVQTLTREHRLTARARELERKRDDLSRRMCVDPLTGLANRRHFDELLRSEWARAETSGAPLALIMADVDEFHTFNERNGHLGGDRCLRAIAEAMAYGLRRPSDLLARYGGEELVVLLPATAAGGAQVVAERLRARVEALAIPRGERARAVVTVSLGATALIPAARQSPAVLIAAADEALFRAKREGRNRVCVDPRALAGARPVPRERPWPACPTALVEPFLATRVPRFLARRREEVSQIRGAAAAGAFERLCRLGHNLKGVGSSYGFDGISALGERLEAAAWRQEPNELCRVADDLAWYLEHVQVVYRRRHEELCCTS